MSTAPRTGDLEILPRNPDAGNPLDLPSIDGDLESEYLPRLFTGETFLRPLGDGDLGAFFLPIFFVFFRLMDVGDRDLERDLEYDLKLRGLKLLLLALILLLFLLRFFLLVLELFLRRPLGEGDLDLGEVWCSGDFE